MNANEKANNFLKGIKPYIFAELDNIRDKLRAEGKDVIDFGIGDPTEPTPQFIRDACKVAIDKRAKSGYPPYEGTKEYKQAAAEWLERRFGVKLDAQNEITATIGAKQEVFMIPMAFTNPGDLVLIPDPGYPAYTTGTKCCSARTYYMPLTESNNFLIEFEKIPEEIVKSAKVMWINYPNNPTTRVAPKSFLKSVVDFCIDNNILLASDEPYTETYYDEKPMSILQIENAYDVAIAIHSLSKRSNMTGWRIGFAAGRSDLIKIFQKLQKNVHSGVATFIQDAAVAALSDEKHVEEMRSLYKQKKEILTKALADAGFPKCYAEATIYIWAKVPEGYDSQSAVKHLLEQAQIICSPGIGFSYSEPPNGEGFLRFAIVPSVERVKEAAERIGKLEF
jgi:LL-diaminopimelate aminotransferase